MVNRLSIVFGLLLLATACPAETRWCNTIKLLPEDKLLYPPIARAARISAVMIGRVIITSAGKISDIEIVAGPVLLTDPSSKQIREWRVTSDATPSNPCLGLVIAGFSIDEYASEKRKTWFGGPPNIVQISIVTTQLVLDSISEDPAPLKRYRWHW